MFSTKYFFKFWYSCN